MGGVAGSALGNAVGSVVGSAGGSAAGNAGGTGVGKQPVASERMTGPPQELVGAAVNEVALVGRLSLAPVARVLPSGDEVVALRVVVPRSGTPRRKGAPTVDVIDIACWSAVTRRAALRLEAGAPIEVKGALRRRFFRGASGVASRYEVEAASVRRHRG